MRIIHLLLIGISISLAAALTKSETPQPAKSKITDTKTKPTTATAPVSKDATKAAKTTTTTASRTGKSLRTSRYGAPEDSRGKRNLYDFGNAGFLYPDIASRRAGYVSDSRSYYPQSGFYNGQNAIAQYPGDFGANYGHYPQYLEAPEPIIEIIIKDSNETLPESPPQRIVTKKKKEKVHVFYVNYKKDENNKLHLESPIASLNNNDETEEEEEEEIVHYPSVVTPLPPLRATTLRTIIHPDSEKFHSNSGIHVSFGSEDKSQTGHILEEHDAESIQRHVVALPATDAITSGVKSDSFLANTRSDFGGVSQGRSPAVNQLYTGPFQQAHSSNFYQSHQELPTQHTNNYFRPPAALVQNQPPQQAAAPPQFYQKPHHQQQQQQQQQQRPSYNPPPTSASPQQPQAQALYRKPPTLQQQLQQQSHYYVNHNQQYQQHQQQQQTGQQSSYYSSLSHKPTQPPKQSVFFPTAPPKVQELPSRQTPAPYQPIKFRPTPPVPQIKPVPIPVKLENSNYQQQQQQHNHQQQQQPQPQYQQHTQHQQKSQQQYQQQHHQSQQQHNQQQPYQFIRQPQFVQQPTFTVTSPTVQPNYYKAQQQSSNVQPTAQYLSQKVNSNKYQTQSQQSSSSSSSSSAASSQSSQGLNALHNLFGVQASKETELLKSIPKFEQHITETIHHNQAGQQYLQQQQQDYNKYSYNNRNQVIHDIPAPNLGPTAQPKAQPSEQSQSSYANSDASHSSLGGHYITASSQNSQQHQFSNFVTSSHNAATFNSFPSSTVAPQYAEGLSTDGQKIMIVTPMPPTTATSYSQYNTNHYNNNQGNQQQSQTLAHVLPNSQLLQTQASNHFVQQPRQSATSVQSLGAAASSSSNSQFSVSTYHSDVFKELQQRNNQQQQQQSAHQQNQVSKTDSPKGGAYIPSAVQAESSTPATASNQHQQQSSGSALPNPKSTQTLLQLPDEVPDDLRQQLLSSGILNNADISVLDYDKVGDVALENLPAEHLQHFYGAGGGAQISESNKVLTVVKPNGDKVALSEKEIERVKQSNSLPQRQNLNVKVVRFDAANEKSVTDKYLKSDATVVPPVDLADRQYNRYLPLKINGAQFPIPDSDELKGKKVVSVVVLAPVDAQPGQTNEGRSERDAAVDGKEVKFLGGDLIKTLVKKPTKENFKRWLEKEARSEVDLQSVVLLVAKSSEEAEQEIFMYDITTGAVNKLNGELSSAFVNVAEENASSEDLEHASTLDPSFLETMMHKSRR